MIKCKVMYKHIVSEIEMEDEANDISFEEKNHRFYLHHIYIPSLHIITFHYISYPQYEKKMQL